MKHILICKESESECRNQQGVMDLLGSCKIMWNNVGLCSLVYVFTLLSCTLSESCRCGVFHRPGCGLSFAKCGVRGLVHRGRFVARRSILFPPSLTHRLFGRSEEKTMDGDAITTIISNLWRPLLFLSGSQIVFNL